MGKYFGLAVMVGVALLLSTGQCAVNCKGEDGHPGKLGIKGRDGLPGPKGEKGEPGKSLKSIQTQSYCMQICSSICLFDLIVLCPLM